MHDRKVAIIKNKKCYMSSDYVRKIINTNRGKNIFNSKPSINDILYKIDGSKNLEISKEQPLILFNRLKKRDINMENLIKKELIENQGFLNNAAIKKNLISFYSQNLSNENMKKKKSKHLFKYPLSAKKNRKGRDKLQTNSELFQSMEVKRRNLQREYSNSIRASLQSSMTKKHKNNKYIGTENVSIKGKNTIEKLSNNILTDKKFIEKLMAKRENTGTMNSITQRKKEFLKMNNISYENIDIKEKENEKNNEKEKKKKVKIFQGKKYINNINNINKKEEEKENKKDIVEEKKKKKIKNVIGNIDAFEYINKIQKEIKNLKIVSNK